MASNELLHGYVCCRGDLRKDRSLGGPSPAKRKETGASIRSRDDGEIRLGYRASRQGDRAGRRIRGLFFGFAEQGRWWWAVSGARGGRRVVWGVPHCQFPTSFTNQRGAEAGEVDRGLGELRVSGRGGSQEALKERDVDSRA